MVNQIYESEEKKEYGLDNEEGTGQAAYGTQAELRKKRNTKQVKGSRKQ